MADVDSNGVDILDRFKAFKHRFMQFSVTEDVFNEVVKYIEELRQERDEARRMYCEEVEHHHETVWNDGERDFKPLPALDVAISKGWDCYKEDGK
jgi:hypothetical protein